MLGYYPLSETSGFRRIQTATEKLLELNHKSVSLLICVVTALLFVMLVLI